MKCISHCLFPAPLLAGYLIWYLASGCGRIPNPY